MITSEKENKDIIDVSDSLENFEEKAEKQTFSPGLYFPTAKKIIRYLVAFAKDKQKISYLILGFLIASIIAICFLLYSALRVPSIPQEALEQPERGLPIED